MFFKTIVISFLLLIGAGFVNSSVQYNQPAAMTTLSENTHIEYVWINGVRWAFVYAEDGSIIDCYPDPI